METDQIVVSAVLAASLVFFVWGRWRYDLVAVVALLVVVVTGIVPSGEAFSGFSHPAIITVAAVLIISQSLEQSGAVGYLTKSLDRFASSEVLLMAALTIVVTALSGFMNNVGALALMMPVAVQIARNNEIDPGKVLMPVAFGSILGGLTTLVGTPPNIIISAFRAEATGQGFEIFDFAPVGVVVAVLAIALMIALGPLLLRTGKRQENIDALAKIDPYLTELRVLKDGDFAGRPLRDIEDFCDGDIAVVAVIRDERERLAPRRYSRIDADDVLVIEADRDTLQRLIDSKHFEIGDERRFATDHLQTEDYAITEAVILPESTLVRRTAVAVGLHRNFGVNLLGVSRQGKDVFGRLGHITVQAGDVVLLQGAMDELHQVVVRLGGLQLAGSNITPGRAINLWPTVLFLLAIAASVLNLIEIQVALVIAVVAIVLVGALQLRDVYQSVDWPIIVLLGAMIPVGGALETTGVTQILAGQILNLTAGQAWFAVVGLTMAVSMALSNVINNAAAAILMAPIALSISTSTGSNPDPLLMAVAIGSSSAFMTPIGHQSNLLVMGPGGYRFGDYWRLGLPVSALVLFVGTPLILWIWPT